MTSDDHEKLIIRPKSNYDLSLPSGNSVSAFVMLRLYHLLHEQKFLDITLKILESQAQMAAENPFGFGYLAQYTCNLLGKTFRDYYNQSRKF